VVVVEGDNSNNDKAAGELVQDLAGLDV